MNAVVQAKKRGPNQFDPLLLERVNGFFKRTLVVRSLVFLDNVLANEPIEIRFGLVKQSCRVFLFCRLLEPLDHGAHLTALHTIALTSRFVLSNTLDGRFMLRHLLVVKYVWFRVLGVSPLI